jgi:hypothetical protein
MNLPITRRRALGLAFGAAAGTTAEVLRGKRDAAATTFDQACFTRYLGYRAVDYAQPYASFFTGKTSPVPDRVTKALAAGPTDPHLAIPHAGLDAEMAEPGYSAVETGYTTLPNGQVWVACLTDMPGVRPYMWDWWFGWHSSQSARYKLWHPDAHASAALKEDRTLTPGLSDKERYVGNVSYVDEYIGPHLEQLAIAFDDPVAAGFPKQALTGTLVYGRVGSSIAPIDLGYLCHQVRPTKNGCEMRSRFFLNDIGFHTPDLVEAACALGRGLAPLPQLPFDSAFGADLLQHCGAEMHHLSTFLPKLYARFSGRPN